jgi:hypothetical protein
MELAICCMKMRYPLAIIVLVLSAVAAKAEDPVFAQSFKYSPSFAGRKTLLTKKDPIVRTMITKAEKAAVGAKIQSSEWLEIGDSAFTSNGSKPQVADAIAMGKRLGADTVFYQITSNGVQTVKHVVVSPEYVEGESGYYNNTTNLPGIGPVTSSGNYGTYGHVKLNPHLATVRTHRYTHWVIYLKTKS